MTSITIYTDGGARGNPGPAASAFVVEDSEQKEVASGFQYLGKTTNNIAEYSAIILALKWLINNQENIDTIYFKLDSLLVVNQLKNIFRIKDINMIKKSQEVKELLKDIKNCHVTFSHIPRTQNFRADALVNSTLDAEINN
jgi:ribonuclease HI